MIRAIVAERDAEGKVAAELRDIEESRLPRADVLVEVSHSTVNYKDGLCLAGKGGLVREYPHVPGIDFAGTVAESADSRWKPGDKVLLTGWRVGEVWWGGYAGKARVKGDWLTAIPEGMDARSVMAVGTAGFTAALALEALERQGLKTGAGPVLVTGAAGGVGSIAVALLAAAGYEVAAVTGRPEEEAYLRKLGAAEILPRADFADAPERVLEKASWAGCVDAVGGAPLARVLTQLKPFSSVAAVGNAAGVPLPTTVIPFLLRGVNLLGIDSVMQPQEVRRAVWARIARDLDRALLESMITDEPLARVPALGADILKGRVRGRVVVNVGA